MHNFCCYRGKYCSFIMSLASWLHRWFGSIIFSHCRETVSISLQCCCQLAWQQEGQSACKKLGAGLLIATIWLELCTSYSSSCHHSPPPSSLAPIKSRMEIFYYWLTQIHLEKWPLKRREIDCVYIHLSQNTVQHQKHCTTIVVNTSTTVRRQDYTTSQLITDLPADLWLSTTVLKTIFFLK